MRETQIRRHLFTDPVALPFEVFLELLQLLLLLCFGERLKDVATNPFATLEHILVARKDTY